MGRRILSFGVLARSPAFAKLLSARALSLIGDGVGSLAVILYVQQSEGMGSAVGLLFLVGSLPRLFSPLAGVVADRVDPRAVLVGGEVAQGILVGILVIWLPPLPFLLLLALGKSTVAMIADPAGRIAIPALVDDADLPAANSFIGALREVGEVAGPLIGGVLVATAGVRAALAVDAFTFMVSVPLLLRVPTMALKEEAAPESVKGVIHSAREGLGYTLSQPVARAVAIGLFFIGLSAAEDVALPFLGRDLGAGPSGIGALFSCVGVGVIAGYLFRARLGGRIPPTAGFVVGAAGIGVANAMTGLSPVIVMAGAFQIARGVGIAVLETDLQTLIQRQVPRAMMGRVFSNVYGAVNLAAAIAVTAGGFLLDATSPRAVLVASGVMALVASFSSAGLFRAARAG